MATPQGLLWQRSLLDVTTGAEPGVDASFAGGVRHQLDDSSWVDHVHGWVSGADTLFEALLERAEWAQPDRLMYGEMVEQPRLTAGWRAEDGRPILPVLGEMADALTARYGVKFDHGGINLYRDGRDSVAWHRDKIPAHIADPIVGIVSLGQSRRFRMRPRGGGRSLAFDPVAGDMLVTGGRAQRDWEHAVPKVAAAGPRMSITFRHESRD